MRSPLLPRWFGLPAVASDARGVGNKWIASPRSTPFVRLWSFFLACGARPFPSLARGVGNSSTSPAVTARAASVNVTI